jgi:transposase
MTGPAIAQRRGLRWQLVATIPNDTTLLLKRLKKLGAAASLRCCYEAGPTGFVLQRELAAAGIACAVIAPSLVPQKAGDRVKTDSRDAVKLARFLRSGDLTEVHVPEASTEAMRDLERCRDGAKRAERHAGRVLLSGRLTALPAPARVFVRTVATP